MSLCVVINVCVSDTIQKSSIIHIAKNVNSTSLLLAHKPAHGIVGAQSSLLTWGRWYGSRRSAPISLEKKPSNVVDP